MVKKYIDKIGHRYGNLLVTERVENCPRKGAQFLCECDCGNKKIIKSCQLQHTGFSTVSCGCVRFMKRTFHRFLHEDLSNKKFGKLQVIHEILELFHKKRGNLYKCKCDCGNFYNVYASSLMNGMTRSCGCLKKEICREKCKINRKFLRKNIGIELRRIKVKELLIKGKTQKEICSEVKTSARTVVAERKKLITT